MENFTVSTLLTKDDYTRCLFRTTYRKPGNIVTTIAGVVFIGISVYLSMRSGRDYSDFLTIAIPGIFLIVSPVIQVFIARKNTFKNPALQFNVEYTFGDEGIGVKGISFESSFAWLHIFKVQEDREFLLLYLNKRGAYFIKKDVFTQQQIDFIKSKVKRR